MQRRVVFGWQRWLFAVSRPGRDDLSHFELFALLHMFARRRARARALRSLACGYSIHTFMPATADAATDGVASLRPAQLDLSRSDEELRPTFLAALSSLTPCLSVVNHGCEERLRSLARAMQQRIEPNAVASKAYAQQAHEFHEHAELAPAAAEVRSACVRSGVLGTLLQTCPRRAGAGLDVRGRLCLRSTGAAS